MPLLIAGEEDGTADKGFGGGAILPRSVDPTAFRCVGEGTDVVGCDDGLKFESENARGRTRVISAFAS
jgi:hypothetical protein